MKNRRLLASVLCVMMLFSNNGVSVLAETQTTASEFTITSEMLGGLVVTIPDEVPLAKSGNCFVGTGRVTAQGATDPINILRVYTHGTITYKNQYKTDITVDADVDFGDVFRTDFGVNCKAEWDAYELKDNMTAREKSGYDVTVTAPFSKVKYIGEYKTNIVFNIELSQSDTFSLGYRLTDSTDVNTSDDNEDINYAILSQTDAVAVLDGVSFSKRDLKRRGYDYIVEYPLNRDATEKYNLDMTMNDVEFLNIPTTVPVDGIEYDVVGVSLDELFKEREISACFSEITLPELLTSIDAYNYEDYCESNTTIICNTYREFVSFNNIVDVHNDKRYLRFKDLDFLWVDSNGVVAGGGDYSAFMKTFGESVDVHKTAHTCKKDRVVKFKLPSKNVTGVRFQNGNAFLGILMQFNIVTSALYGNTTGGDYYMPKQIWVVPKTYKYYNGFQQAPPVSSIHFVQPQYTYQANLKGVIFEDGYSGSIGALAFQGFSSPALDEVVIPASTKSIAGYAFCNASGQNWANIKNLYIDYDGTTTVGGFLGVYAQNLYFSGTEEEWKASPYYNNVPNESYGNIYFNTKYNY